MKPPSWQFECKLSRPMFNVSFAALTRSRKSTPLSGASLQLHFHPAGEIIEVQRQPWVTDYKQTFPRLVGLALCEGCLFGNSDWTLRPVCKGQHRPVLCEENAPFSPLNNLLTLDMFLVCGYFHAADDDPTRKSPWPYFCASENWCCSQLIRVSALHAVRSLIVNDISRNIIPSAEIWQRCTVKTPALCVLELR